MEHPPVVLPLLAALGACMLLPSSLSSLFFLRRHSGRPPAIISANSSVISTLPLPSQRQYAEHSKRSLLVEPLLVTCIPAHERAPYTIYPRMLRQPWQRPCVPFPSFFHAPFLFHLAVIAYHVGLLAYLDSSSSLATSGRQSSYDQSVVSDSKRESS